MTRSLLVTLAILSASIVGAAAAWANNAGDFTLYPTYMHNGNKNWLIRQAAPGSTVEETLTLENLSDTKQEISLLVREAKEENGNFITATSIPFENVGNWIRTEGNKFSLLPHQKIRIPVQITIPREAKDREYTAAILASKKEPSGPSLNITTQIGVRLYLTVTPSYNAFTDIFSTPEYKSNFFLALSASGLAASIFYYLINRKESKGYAKKHA